MNDRVEPISTNAGQSAPPADTDRNTGRAQPGGADASIPDPDYGLDRNITGPGYGSTGRGNEHLADMTGDRRRPLEGIGVTAMTGRDALRSDVARGGDTTSNADSYQNTLHGMGESGVRGAMPQGADQPGMANGGAGDPRPDVDLAEESTLEQGQQYAQSDRA
jgi:hypothetical protein